MTAAIAGLVVCCAATLVAWHISPEFVLTIGDEAGWAEAATAYAFLAGGIAALAGALALQHNRTALVALGLCGLLGFNDETNQLARQGLQFRMPHQTVNASIDIFDSLYKTLDKTHTLPFVIAAIIAYVALKKDNPIRSFAENAINQGGVPLLILYILAIGATAKLIDLGLLVKSGMTSKPMSRVFEEVLELDIALTYAALLVPLMIRDCAGAPQNPTNSR